MLETNNKEFYYSFNRIKKEAFEIMAHAQEKADTSNGIPHIKEVEYYINLLIPTEIKKELENIELYILLAGIYLHDIGRFKSKEDHPKTSAEIINEDHEGLGLLDTHVADAVCDIIKYHGSDREIKLPTSHPIGTHGSADLEFLAAILRLGDELSLSYVRAPKNVQNLVTNKKLMSEEETLEWQDEYKIKWNLRSITTGVVINPRNWKIEIQVRNPPKALKPIFKNIRSSIQKKLDRDQTIIERKGLLFRKIDISFMYSKFEVEEIIRKREDLDEEEWQDFYDGSKKRIYIMGQSMWGFFEYNEDIIMKKLKKGIDVRVILLNPYYDSQQLNKVNRELNVDLVKKIKDSLSKCHEIQGKATLNQYAGKLLAKITNDIIYCSLSIVDNLMYINPYSNNPEGDKCPVILLKKMDNSGLFNFYEQEFNKMWKNAEYPQDIESNVNYRIFKYEKDIKNIHKAISASHVRIPYPKMAIIYITYQCESECPSCMYNKKRKNKTGELDMKVELFERIVNDLVKLGIESIELSGGGEPLEHQEIGKILRIVEKIKEDENNNCEFGLLTNGLRLNNNYLEDILLNLIINNFKYVRLTLPEITDNNRRKEIDYLANLKDFVKESTESENSNVRVGAKILLTKENIGELQSYLNFIYSTGVDHVKIKSIRGLSEKFENEICDCEDMLYAYKFLNKENFINTGELPKREDLQIDIRETKIPNGFECWINPIFTTIDPDGNVFICYNYHNDEKSMKIGQYNLSNSLDEFWGNADHKNLIKNIDIDKVCKASNACNCRFVYYQKIVEETLKIRERTRFDYDNTNNEIVQWYQDEFNFI